MCVPCCNGCADGKAFVAGRQTGARLPASEARPQQDPERSGLAAEPAEPAVAEVRGSDGRETTAGGRDEDHGEEADSCGQADLWPRLREHQVRLIAADKLISGLGSENIRYD